MISLSLRSFRPMFVAFAVGAVGAAGCDESGPRVYTAQAYHPDLGCLDPFTPIGLVQSVRLPADCTPACLTEGAQLYVSPVCPPYPAEATVVSPTDSADCQAALAAYAAGTLCGATGSTEAGSDTGEDSTAADSSAPDEQTTDSSADAE